MNKRLPLLPLFTLLSIVIAPAVTRAEDKPAGGKDDSGLHDSMEEMQGPFRKLRRQVADPAKNEASIALVAKLAKATEEAAQHLPNKIAKLPAEAQAAAKASYEEKMKKLSATIAELGEALKAGKNEDAVKILEDIHHQEEVGHREFRPKKQKKVPNPDTAPAPKSETKPEPKTP